MKHHYNPITTNARQGKPLSELNHRRANRWPILFIFCALFWVAVAATFLNL